MILFYIFYLTFVLLNPFFGEGLKARAWRSKNPYPTDADYPEYELFQNKPNTAIAFSGGGSRAFIGAMGYLAALRDLSLLQNIRYIGGISGGAWAAMAFTYLQNHTNDEIFLGKITQPEDIQYEKLNLMNSECARSYVDVDVAVLAYELYKTKNASSFADAWSLAVSEVYLKPIGVQPNTYFSWNYEAVIDIKQRNPELQDSKFVIPVHPNRAFPIIGTTLVGPKVDAPFIPSTQNYSLLEITPLYFGTLRDLNISYVHDVTGPTDTIQIGGFLEPYATAWYGGAAPAQGLPAGTSSGILDVPMPVEALDLRYALGATSYATGTFFESLLLPPLAQALSLQCDYFAPTDTTTPSLYTMMLGDGGSYENIPLISFLQRRVSKIILFFMSSIPLQPYEDWNVLEDAEEYDHITDDFAAFFGAINYTLSRYENRTYEYEKNQVFSLSDFNRVVLGLQYAQQEGDGIIYTANLTTVENVWWGIPAGLTVEVTFSYLGRLSQWEKKLSPEMYKLVVPAVNSSDLSVDITTGPFHDFPHYKTEAGNINAERANLLADLTGWSVLQHAELFTYMLS